MLITEILKEPERFRACVNQGLPYKLLSVKIKIVDKCNLRCKMCSHWRHYVEALPFDFYKPVIKDLVELGCQKIHFTGGEPMLYPNLLSLMDFIRQCDDNIKISMTTNATLIDEEMAKVLAQSGLKRANISIDSPEESIHDSIRGVHGAFRKACYGFQCLRKHMPKRPFYINTVLSPWNYKTLIGLPKLANELGATGVNLQSLNIHTVDSFPFTAPQWDEINKDILPGFLDEANKYHISIDIPQISSNADGYYNNHRCYVLYSHLLINYLGFVYPCCNLTNTRMGDLHKHSIKEIWQGDKYQTLRQKQQLPIHPKCATCDLCIDDNIEIDKLFEQSISAPICHVEERTGGP